MKAPKIYLRESAFKRASFRALQSVVAGADFAECMRHYRTEEGYCTTEHRYIARQDGIYLEGEQIGRDADGPYATDFRPVLVASRLTVPS